MSEIPFEATRPASASMFVGRETIKRQLADGLRSGRCFSLVGGPGIGKTSLLRAVQRDLDSVHKKESPGSLPLPIYVECKRNHAKAEEILTRIVDNLLDETIPSCFNLSSPHEIRGLALSKAERGGLEIAFQTIMEWLFAREKRSFMPILLLDDLHRVEGDCFQKLTAILEPMVNYQKLALTLAGKHILEEELRDDVSPLRLLISQHFKLGPLDRGETRLLMKKASRRSAEKGFGELLFDMTKGHPYRLHYYLYGVLLKEGALTVSGLKNLGAPDTVNHLNRILEDKISEKPAAKATLGGAKTVTWLHLSDLHYCEPKTGWDAEDILDKLVEDLKELEEERGLLPDLILFTGDLAFGESKNADGWRLKDQYDGVHDFLKKVRNAFSRTVPKENLFLVPGNHDVNRAYAARQLTFWLDNLDDESEVTEMIKEAGFEWSMYMERLKEYRSFIEDYGFNHLLADPDRLIYAVVKRIGKLNVGIGGFNSVWSCCRPSKEEKSKLRLGAKWQLNTIRSRLKDVDFSVALIHHPPNWFVEEEDKKFLTRLREKFDFCLHGHEHEEWVVSQTGNGHTMVSASACYQRSDKLNGYNIVRLDLENQTGEVWLRKYSDAGPGGWIPNILPGKKTDKNGMVALTKMGWMTRLKMS